MVGLESRTKDQKGMFIYNTPNNNDKIWEKI